VKGIFYPPLRPLICHCFPKNQGQVEKNFDHACPLALPPILGREIWLLQTRRVVFNQQAMSKTHPLTTTAFELPGYRITKSFGVVRGIMVRSRSVIGNFGASLQSIFGGNISIYTSLCERTREDTFNLMLTHAGELGANAVIGVRYDATEIAPGITEVLCYGTAVLVEPA
jgi:uncharacterized protein YbjQ (UPF0145 family)